MRTIAVLLTAIVILLSFTGIATAQGIEYVSSILWSEPNGVKVVDTLLYCGYRNGLVILNVANPAEPTLISELYLLGGGTYLDIQGHYVYLTGQDFGLQVVDITDPLNPVLVGQHYIGHPIMNIDVEDDHALVVEQHALRIFDISNPEEPALVGTYGGFYAATDVQARGDTVFITEYLYNVIILDISTPEQPQFVSSLEGYNTYAIALSGSIVYLGLAENGLRALDISDITHPTVIWACDSIAGNNDDIIVAGSALHVVGPIHYTIFDITDPANPSLITSLPTGATRLDVYGNYTYLGRPGSYPDREDKVEIIDIHDLTSPARVGSYINIKPVTDVTVIGDYALLAMDTCALKVCDISDPVNPQIVGQVPESRRSRVFSSGNYLYSRGKADTVRIIDFADYPDYEVLYSGPIADSKMPMDMEFQGDFAYFTMSTDQYSYLTIANISNPRNPACLANLRIPHVSAKGLFVEGAYAYIIGDSSYTHTALTVVDISDPSTPQILSQYFICRSIADFWRTAYDVYVSGGYAYVADGYVGYHVIDVEDPNNPYLINTFPSSGYVVDIYVTNNLLMVVDLMRGIRIFGIDDPFFPYIIDSLDAATDQAAICVRGDYIYSAEREAFTIYRADLTGIKNSGAELPVEISLLQNYPNPFNAQTRISYSLPFTGPVKLAIYDILGRQVQTLIDGTQNAGAHSVIWNADNFASGVYFYRLTAGDKGYGRMMTLIK